MAINLEGGGKALMAWPLVEDFFAASLSATSYFKSYKGREDATEVCFSV